MDKFEKLIKTSVESYEAPYSEEAWDALSKQLGPEKGLSTRWYVGGAILAASIVLSIWYLSPSADIMSHDNSKAIIVNHIDRGVKTDGVNENTEPVEHVDISDSNSSENIKDDLTETKPIDLVENPTITSNQTIVEDHNNADPISKPEDHSNITPIASDNITQNDNQVGNTEHMVSQVDFSKFNLNVIASENEVCLGQSISFSASIPKIKAEYQWVLGNGDILTGPYIDYTFEQAGNYNVSIQLIDAKTKKVVNKSEPVAIIVNAKPLNEISYEFNDNTLLPRANFKQKNTNVKNTAWEIKGVHKSSEKSFSYDFKHKGNYIIICQLIDHNGCQSISKIMVSIENDYNLLAPSAFTPNGDNLNETFIPKALLVTNAPFIMTIYDKSGKLVFETNDASRPWDGLYKTDFSPAPTGSYVWVVQLTNEQNKTETYQGQVTITR